MIELRVCVRSRDRADVYELSDTRRLEEIDEGRDCASAMPNSVDGGMRRRCGR